MVQLRSNNLCRQQNSDARGPKNLPPTIVDRLSREVRRIVQLPGMKQQFERRSLLARDYDVAGLNAFLRAEVAFWVPLAKDLRLKVE